jgi:hypothetical protein
MLIDPNGKIINVRAPRPTGKEIKDLLTKFFVPLSDKFNLKNQKQKASLYPTERLFTSFRVSCAVDQMK